MSVFKLIIFSFLLLALSCETKPPIVDKPISDTTNILKMALRTATSGEFMPSVSALKPSSKFGDTILLTAIPISLESLPTSTGEQIFKVLPRETIYRVLTGESYRHDGPNYLCVSQFEKNDTGYYIQVQNLSALPFGGGGSLGLYFKKVSDTLTIVNKASSSIN